METLEEVSAPQKNEIHKEISEITPNQMYKNYTKWVQEKHKGEKKPLTFKEWLQWAKSRNIIGDYSITGDEPEKEQSNLDDGAISESRNDENDIEGVKKNKSGILVLTTVLLVTLIIVGFSKN